MFIQIFYVFLFILFFFNISYINIYIWLYIYLFNIIVLVFSYINIFYLGRKGFFYLNSLNLILLSIITLYVYVTIFFYDFFFFFDFYQIYFFEENISFNITIFLTNYNYSFINLTILIGFAAYIYAYGYMRDEVFLERFLMLLHSFLLSMVFLLLSNNFVTLILGWELIGITSYFLINFWINKISTFKSAYKAFIFNRLSDISIIIFFLIFFNFYKVKYFSNSIQIYDYNYYYYYYYLGFLINGHDILIFFLIIAAFCKSAQFGFHIWLPDSMEAPVPASALIHSATLVSAGIYILGKFWEILFLSFYSYNIYIFISLWTSLYGALIAIYQTDIKKILAFSTINHCGLLMFLLNNNNFIFFIIYLYFHGFFKSLSFMCVGNIIKNSKNLQDFRYMGGKFRTNKFEFFFLIFSLINLSGLNFTVGYFSKHFLFISIDIFIKFFLYILLFTANIGFFYSFNIIYNVFFNFFKNFKKNYNFIGTSFSTLTSPTQIISILILTYILFFFIFFFLYNFNYLNYYFYINTYINSSICYQNIELFKFFFVKFFLNWFIIYFLFNFFLFIFFKNYQNFYILFLNLFLLIFLN